MKCGGCNFDRASRVRVIFDHKSKTTQEVCDECANTPSVWLPDVFLESAGGGEIHNDNLRNPDTGKTIPYCTKREKAAILKMLKIREAGDFRHGARDVSRRRKYI
jgi:hypothetical protein